MKVSLEPGKYVLAVSGGVDSMVLLDVLRRMPGIELVVAHFEHGIREDSDLDRELVQRVAEKHGLLFVFERGNLGRKASEATAREARYEFLRKTMEAHHTQAIITAHHQDDLIETAMLNMLRGTGRKGLSSLRSQPDVIRPLLNVRKQQLYEYVSEQQRLGNEIIWNEDSTNRDDRYLRNYIRNNYMHGLGTGTRELLISYISKATESNPIIDGMLLHEVTEHSEQGKLDRQWFIGLPHDISREVMASWLRLHDVRSFDKKAIERLVVAAKTAQNGKSVDVLSGTTMSVHKDFLRIVPSSSRQNG